MRIDTQDDHFRGKAQRITADAAWGGYVAQSARGRTPGQRPAQRNYFMSAAAVNPGKPVNRDPGKVRMAARALKRILLPVLGLIVALLASWLYRDTPVTVLDHMFHGPEQPVSLWLTWGHVLLATSFFAIHLTNRRYGPSYAVAQIALVWTAVAGLFATLQLRPDLLPIPVALPEMRLTIACGLALLLAQLAAAVIFDGTRGVRWWQAPLFGSFWAGFVFVAVFYPSAYAGTDIAWMSRMVIHFGILTAASVALLIPYWICRPLVRPLPGFGG